MHKAIPLAVAVILLSGCSSGVSSDDASSSGTPSALPSETSLPSLALPSETPEPGASTSTSTFPSGADWALVSGGLTRPGAQVVFDIAAGGQTVVASVLTEDTPDDFDAGIVFSRDAGATWAWGGVVADEGRTFPEGVLLDRKKAVIVGSNQGAEGPNGIASRAFMAVAQGPDFVPAEVDLPPAFDGIGVQLQDIVEAGGEWVVAGYVQGAVDAKGKAHPTGVLWRSGDRGRSWTKQVVEVPGAKDIVLKQLVIAPDGSWNLVGQVAADDIFTQYDALWLRSTDEGRTFTQMGKKGFVADSDQGATRIAFAPDGSAAILGWSEVTEEHGNVSAIWLKVPGHDLSPVADGGIPVDGASPTGEFIDGILWNDATLVAWGSVDGSYPMPDAQFWTLEGGRLAPLATLPGNGTTLSLTQVLPVGDSLLGVGFTGDLDQADAAVWKAALAQ